MRLRSTGGRSGKRRSPRELAIGTAVLAAVLTAVASWNYWVHNAPWREEVVRAAQAQVLEVDRGRRSDRATVTFRDPQGQEVTVETRVRENSVEEGERLGIEYVRPADDAPMARVPGNWRPGYSVAGIGAAAGLVVALVAGALHWWGRSRRAGSVAPREPSQPGA